MARAHHILPITPLILMVPAQSQISLLIFSLIEEALARFCKLSLALWGSYKRWRHITCREMVSNEGRR